MRYYKPALLFIELLAEHVTLNPNTRVIALIGVPHKMAMFADDAYVISTHTSLSICSLLHNFTSLLGLDHLKCLLIVYLSAIFAHFLFQWPTWVFGGTHPLDQNDLCLEIP